MRTAATATMLVALLGIGVAACGTEDDAKTDGTEQADTADGGNDAGGDAKTDGSTDEQDTAADESGDASTDEADGEDAAADEAP